MLALSIPAGGKPEFAVADGHGLVYFNVEDKGELAVLDAATLKIKSHYSLAPCQEPSGLALDPRGRLYSVCQNGVMVISDPSQGRVIGQAPIGLSGLATGASWVCYFRALQIGEASKVAPVDKLSVVLVAVFAVAFLGERPAARDWMGIALVAAGVVVLALKR